MTPMQQVFFGSAMTAILLLVLVLAALVFVLYRLGSNLTVLPLTIADVIHGSERVIIQGQHESERAVLGAFDTGIKLSVSEIQKTRHSVHNYHQAVVLAPIRELPRDGNEPDHAFDSDHAPTAAPILDPTHKRGGG